jgi:hypothetical protein
MFAGSPIFVRVSNNRWVQPNGGWFLLLPGLMLIVLALAILVWPELLAYLVAGALLMVGVVLTGWGWSVRQAARRMRRSNYVTYTPDHYTS